MDYFNQTEHFYDRQVAVEPKQQHHDQHEQQQEPHQTVDNSEQSPLNVYRSKTNELYSPLAVPVEDLSKTSGDGDGCGGEATSLMVTDSKKCSACDDFIYDQFLMRIGNQFWHETCLNCNVCHSLLNHSCFVRDSKVYCKYDYERIFMIRCSQCHQKIQTGDLVMRAQLFTYHLDCFQCTICASHLRKGDHFIVSGDGQLVCERDFSLTTIIDQERRDYHGDMEIKHELHPHPHPHHHHQHPSIENVLLLEKDPKLIADIEMGTSSNLDGKQIDLMNHENSNDKENSGGGGGGGGGDDDDDDYDDGDLDVDDDELDPEPEDLLVFENLSRSRLDNELGGGGGGPIPARNRSNTKSTVATASKNTAGNGNMNNNNSKRPRTILTTLQRKLFKAAFELSPKPCRKTRENLAKETGLNIRVVQVWFQNQRAKIKKIEKKTKSEMRSSVGGGGGSGGGNSAATATKRYSHGSAGNNNCNRYATAHNLQAMQRIVPSTITSTAVGSSSSSSSVSMSTATSTATTTSTNASGCGLDDENTSNDFLSDTYSMMNDMIDVYNNNNTNNSHGTVGEGTVAATAAAAATAENMSTVTDNSSAGYGLNGDLSLGFRSPIDNLFSMHNFYFDDSVVTSSSSMAGDFF